MLQCSTIDQFFDDLVSTIRRHLQAQTCLHSRKRALDVSQDVVDVLDANRQADEVVVDAQRHATLLRLLDTQLLPPTAPYSHAE